MQRAPDKAIAMILTFGTARRGLGARLRPRQFPPWLYQM